MSEFSTDAQTISKIYDEFGQYYHDSRQAGSGRFANEFIDVPTLLSIVGEDLNDLNVLDAGCGSGVIARMLAKKNANVFGVDASEQMIRIAQSLSPFNSSLKFSIADIAHMDFDKEVFDLIVCNYVLENIEDVRAVFKEFSRTLKIDGRCIVSISHPLRALMQKTEKSGHEVWTVENYFQGGMRMSDFGGGMVVPKYRRTIADYFEAFASAGFVASKLLEPQSIAEAQAIDPERHEVARRLPQLLMLELVKK